MVKNLAANAGDVKDAVSVSGSRRSSDGAYGYPLQYSCLENPMDREVWWATIHGIAMSQTRLIDLTHYTISKRRVPLFMFPF